MERNAHGPERPSTFGGEEEKGGGEVVHDALGGVLGDRVIGRAKPCVQRPGLRIAGVVEKERQGQISASASWDEDKPSRM